jgi:hypothetical protein
MRYASELAGRIVERVRVEVSPGHFVEYALFGESGDFPVFFCHGLPGSRARDRRSRSRSGGVTRTATSRSQWRSTWRAGFQTAHCTFFRGEGFRGEGHLSAAKRAVREILSDLRSLH